jgi:rubredoxin
MARQRGRPRGSKSPLERHDFIIKQFACPCCHTGKRTRLRNTVSRAISPTSQPPYKRIVFSYCNCRNCGAALRIVRYLA